MSVRKLNKIPWENSPRFKSITAMHTLTESRCETNGIPLSPDVVCPATHWQQRAAFMDTAVGTDICFVLVARKSEISNERPNLTKYDSFLARKEMTLIEF